MLGWNLTLAVAWCAMAGQLTIVELALGFAAAFVMLAWLDVGGGGRRYARRLPIVFAFTVLYAFDIMRSSVRVAWDVLTPGSNRRLSIVRVPLELRSPTAVVLLANLITFSPGTLALDVADDCTSMTVHTMYVADPDVARDAVKRFERWVRRMLQ